MFVSSFTDGSYLVTDRNDYVKNVKSFENIARAIDLYLALENAYKQWDQAEWNDTNSTTLLGDWDKLRLNNALMAAVQNMHSNYLYGHNSELAQIFNVENYEAEPGNRPLKGFLAAGYAALAIQNPFNYPYDSQAGITEREIYDNELGSGNSTFFNVGANAYFIDARDKASSPATNNNSVKYWMYQSSGGEKEWAEGPYYLDYALADAIPFWHAVRINGLLGSTPDPFKGSNKWFLNPVEWLADISTPDGYIPPIDDGNKFRIRNTDLLRWSDAYGDPTVGGKFATVYNNTLKYYGTAGQTYNFNDYQYLIDVAIPKRSVSSTVSLPNLAHSSEQQYVIRHTDNASNDHYIFFNKETSNAITRGEGHEQPDQMQVLYYINDDSYLVDGGYDAGSDKPNSSWNGYFYHNVMHYSYGYLKTHYGGYIQYQNYGGLESPKVVVNKARKVSEHAGVTNTHFRNVSNKLKAIEGEVNLNITQATPAGDLYFEGGYKRRIVAILDDSPYVVDFNTMEEMNQPTGMLQKMHYYGNSNYFTSKPNIEDWSYWDISNSNPIPNYDDAKNLYISAVSEDAIDNQEAYGNDIFEVLKMKIQEYENRDNGPKEPYFVKRKVYAHSDDEKDFGLITFIKADDQTPTKSLQKLSLGNNVHAGFYEHGNYIDLAVLRTSGTNQNLSFSIIESGISIPSIMLPSGKDYGFARFEKTNGVWEINSDYQINMSRHISSPQNLVITNDDGSGGGGGPGPGPDPTPENVLGPVQLDWDDHNSPIFDHFEVYRKKRYTGGQQLIATPTASSYTDFEIAVGSGSDEFQYTVRAVATGSDQSDYSNYTKWVVGSTPEKGISNNSQQKLPKEFNVESNYPNPFNPSTTIKYGIPERAEVTVKVYNILGQNVAKLVNETKAPGFYTVRFEASGLASGLYIARLVAEGGSGEQFVKELKMQFIK